LVFNELHEILTITRNIEPIGEALPGGYQVDGENWRTALQRELWEEALIRVSTNPSDMPLFDVQTTPDTKQNLMFAVVRPRGLLEVAPFTPTDETSRREFRKISRDNIPKLCFPLHEAAIRKSLDYEMESLGDMIRATRGIHGYSDVW
jgi:ADP-ribose pyrophosphatase YjhB (NUDIX family)